MGRANCQVHLPAEILDIIFQLLPARDLRAVVQVCRFWREVREAPGLWSCGGGLHGKGGHVQPA